MRRLSNACYDGGNALPRARMKRGAMGIPRSKNAFLCGTLRASELNIKRWHRLLCDVSLVWLFHPICSCDFGQGVNEVLLHRRTNARSRSSHELRNDNRRTSTPTKKPAFPRGKPPFAQSRRARRKTSNDVCHVAKVFRDDVNPTASSCSNESNERARAARCR